MIVKKYFLNFLTIFLLIFGPGLVFVTQNISNYFLSYLVYPLILQCLVFLLVISFYYINIFFFKKNVLNKRIIIFVSLLWFLSFYFKDILIFFNIGTDEYHYLKIIIVLIFIVISILIAKKINYFLKNFLCYLIIFLILINFIINANFSFLRKQIEITQNNYINLSEINLIKKDNKKNVYFFLTDEFTSVDILKELGLNIDEFINKKIKDGYQYLKNSKSSHNSTQYSIGTIFNLEYYKTNTNIYPEYFYPELLFKNEKPNLFKILEKNNYKFWMLGNQYIHCLNDKHTNCIKKNNFIEKIIEDEGLNVFINKTFFNNLYYKLKSYYYSKKVESTQIDEFYNFLENKNNIIKNNNNFFFIHHINPHYPYRNEKCKILDIQQRFKMNNLNYISSVKCTLTKINLITEKIEKIDPDSIIIFQGDHGFTKFNYTAEIEKSFRIFNLIRLPKKCNQNLQKNLGTVETINAVFDCLYEKKRKFENPSQSFITDESSVKYKKFYILKK